MKFSTDVLLHVFCPKNVFYEYGNILLFTLTGNNFLQSELMQSFHWHSTPPNKVSKISRQYALWPLLYKTSLPLLPQINGNQLPLKPQNTDGWKHVKSQTKTECFNVHRYLPTCHHWLRYYGRFPPILLSSFLQSKRRLALSLSNTVHGNRAGKHQT